MDRRGTYTAERAAALSGVPKNTIYHWARREILVPCVSVERVKLWSYRDLLALRTIAWLIPPKQVRVGSNASKLAMPAIRRALAELRNLELSQSAEDRERRVVVDRHGEIHLQVVQEADEALDRTIARATDFLDLFGPFSAAPGQRGPDLHTPRPSLRIVPGKLSGSPHIVHTRIETVVIAALRDRNVSVEQIRALYPMVGEGAIDEAIDLELQLRQNIAA